VDHRCPRTCRPPGAGLKRGEPRNRAPHVKKNDLKPWRIGVLNEEYRSRMYDLLALYAKPLCHKEPVICIDEKSLQFIGHSRLSLPMAPHAPTKEDY
jgi:hypothetical protein